MKKLLRKFQFGLPSFQKAVRPAVQMLRSLVACEKSPTRGAIRSRFTRLGLEWLEVRLAPAGVTLDWNPNNGNAASTPSNWINEANNQRASRRRKAITSSSTTWPTVPTASGTLALR